MPTSAWAQAVRLAVLELANEGADLSAPHLRILSDAGRKAVLSLDPARHQVLTRESMQALLPADTDLASLCEAGACEVTIGRRLGVDYVVSGAATRLEGVLRADLKLHATKDGRLLGMQTAKGASISALESDVTRQVARMLAALPSATPVAGPTVHTSLDAKLASVTTAASAPAAPASDDFAAQMAALERAQQAREAAAAAEQAARLRALKAHTREVDQRWAKVTALARQDPARGAAAAGVLLAHYAGHTLGNPRGAEATALKARLEAKLEADAQAAHEAQVEQAWRLTERVAKRGGPEGRKALKAFLARYASHPRGNPRQRTARALLSRGAGGGDPGKAGIEWVRIPGGTFQMGSTDGDRGERPLRRVRVPTFELAKTEVTVVQYRACVQAGRCTKPKTGGSCNWGKADRDDHPINCVDHGQAQAFAKWAGGRLPSEAEWEYAARSGGRDQTYPWGDREASCAQAVMDDGGNGCGTGGTLPVCSKPAGNSAQGICDLAGNVWEWVEDWYGPYRDAPSSDGSARVNAAQYRVFRGGGWFDTARYLWAVNRSRGHPGYRSVYLGFRLARSAR